MDSRITPFTKIEKLSISKYKPPRLIQARNLTFNVEYGRYIKPIEKALSKRVQFGKGTPHQVAKRIMNLKKKYQYYTECDHKTFDSHVTVEMLQLTHTFYASCYNHDKNLRKLAKRTLKNKCKTRNGEKYTIKGTRMSGDVDTSLGNSLINYAILKTVVKDIVGKCEVIVNGDDSIIFSTQRIDVKLLTNKLKEYNMETEVKESQKSIHKIDFCQQRLIYDHEAKPTMMPDYNRVLSRFGMTYKQLNNYQEYIKDLVVCNIYMYHSNIVGYKFLNMYKNLYGKFKHIDIMGSRVEDKMKINVKNSIENLDVTKLVININDYIDISVFNAYNIDSIDKEFLKLENRIRIINSKPRLHTNSIKNLPVNNLIFINHDHGIIKTIRN